MKYEELVKYFEKQWATLEDATIVVDKSIIKGIGHPPILVLSNVVIDMFFNIKTESTNFIFENCTEKEQRRWQIFLQNIGKETDIVNAEKGTSYLEITEQSIFRTEASKYFCEILNFVKSLKPVVKEKKNMTYFDLEFDFENGKFWKNGTTRKKSLQFIDETGNKTNYYSFKILLENKGQFLSKKDFLKKEYPLPSAGSVSTIQKMFTYLKKLKEKFQISKNGIFSGTCWIQISPDKQKIKIISDED